VVANKPIVLAAILLAQWWFGRSRSRLLKLSAASSAYDYRLQTRSLEQMVAVNHAHDDAVSTAPGTPAPQGCSLCAPRSTSR